MDLFDRFMEGLELRDPDRLLPRPIDFAVSNDTSTLVLLAGWWTISWGMEAGLLPIPGVLNPKTLLFDGMESSGLHISTPTDGDWAARLHDARRLTDVARDRYLGELLRLVEFEPSFDFTPWIEAVQSRPPVDLVASMLAGQTSRRTVGMIALQDDAGSTVDVLAIDERGHAATFDDEGWLGLFASRWAGYAEGARPDVAAFLDWLAEQRPYGSLSLGSPQVTSVEGELQTLITNALAQTPVV